MAGHIVSRADTFMLAGQKVTVGEQHARAVVQVVSGTGEFRVFRAGALIATVARATETTVTRRRYCESQRRAG